MASYKDLLDLLERQILLWQKNIQGGVWGYCNSLP